MRVRTGYIVIVAGRYGIITKKCKLSYTEMEYQYAVETKKPVIAFVHMEITTIAEDTIDNVSFCIITSPSDLRYGNLLDIYNGGFKKDDHNIKLIVVKGMGHGFCSGKILDEALSFVEG